MIIALYFVQLYFKLSIIKRYALIAGEFYPCYPMFQLIDFYTYHSFRFIFFFWKIDLQYTIFEICFDTFDINYVFDIKLPFEGSIPYFIIMVKVVFTFSFSFSITFYSNSIFQMCLYRYLLLIIQVNPY